jgi:hypothetical protein
MQVGPLRRFIRKRRRKIPERAQKKIRGDSFFDKRAPAKEPAIIRLKTMLPTSLLLVFRVMIAWISAK